MLAGTASVTSTPPVKLFGPLVAGAQVRVKFLGGPGQVFLANNSSDASSSATAYQFNSTEAYVTLRVQAGESLYAQGDGATYSLTWLGNYED